MTWLVLTGVNGFIGHNLALELLFPGPETYAPAVDFVLGTDLGESTLRPTHRRLEGLPNYRFARAKEETIQAIEAETKRQGCPPLAVIHNGACSSTTVTDPEIFRVQNVKASQTLFRYCAQHNVPLIYASSASVYGNGSQGFSDAIEATSSYHPMNLYGQSKHTFDSWVIEQTERPPVWFGLRYFNVFGPFEDHKLAQASIFYWGRQQILASGKLKLFESHVSGLANGHQQRDFVPVQDICRVTWKLLRLALEGVDFPHGGRFVNVGRGEAVTWIDVGGALFDALDRRAVFEFIPMPQALRKHYQNYTCADLSSLRELGIREPWMKLEKAFRRSLETERTFALTDTP